MKKFSVMSTPQHMIRNRLVILLERRAFHFGSQICSYVSTRRRDERLHENAETVWSKRDFKESAMPRNPPVFIKWKEFNAKPQKLSQFVRCNNSDMFTLQFELQMTISDMESGSNHTGLQTAICRHHSFAETLTFSKLNPNIEC